MYITATFDPDEVYTVTDIAQAVGVQPNTAYKWVQRNIDKIPDGAPLFGLNLKGKRMFVWDRLGFENIVQAYEDKRA